MITFNQKKTYSQKVKDAASRNTYKPGGSKPKPRPTSKLVVKKNYIGIKTSH